MKKSFNKGSFMPNLVQICQKDRNRISSADALLIFVDFFQMSEKIIIEDFIYTLQNEFFGLVV